MNTTSNTQFPPAGGQLGNTPLVFTTAVPSQVSTSRVTILFDQLTLKQAQAIVNSRRSELAVTNLAFFNGDHWQEGEGWVGPRMTAISQTADALTMTEIQKQFVSRNAIAEVTRRQTAGVLGHALHWKFTVKRELAETEETDPVTGQVTIKTEEPTAEEQSLIAEAEAALDAWWDQRSAQRELEQMNACALLTKRGVLRLFVPPDQRDENGNLPPGDLNACLDYIHLQHLGTNEDTLDLQFPSATVYWQKSSRRPIGIFTYAELPDLVEAEETAATDAGDENQRAELTYFDDAQNTVLRVINSEGDIEPPMVMPLGGRLTMFEMTRALLVSPQVVSQQKSLNLSLTMKQRNAVQGGFLERIFSNVQWPGKYKDGIEKPENFIPEPYKGGPGTSVNLMPVVYDDGNGHIVMGNPQVTFRDPVSPTNFIQTEESVYLNILQEVQQLHYANAAESVVSGESRKQARDAFTLDLHLSAGQVEAAARWMLETVLALASYFAGRPGAFEGLRVYVQARIDSGPISADDMRAAVQMRDADIWSTERAMSQTGVEDVDAEEARIKKERQEEAAVNAASFAAAQQLMAQTNPQDNQQGNQNNNPFAQNNKPQNQGAA